MNIRSKRICKSIIYTCVCVMLFYGSQGFAKTYYVANTIACSDSWTGDKNHPWCTLTHAANSVSAGDVVIVKDGVYHEGVYISRSGTSETSRVIFRSKNKWGADIVKGFYINASYVTIDGFKISNPHNGKPGSSAVEISNSSHHIIISNLYIQNANGRAITVYGSNQKIIGNYIYHCEMGIYVKGNHIVVEDNEVERLYRYSGVFDSDYARFFGKDQIWRRNYFHGTKKSEIGPAHVDAFQYADDSGWNAIDIIIEKNKCFDFHEGLMLENDKHFYNTGIVVRNNVFANSWAWGWCIKAIKNLEIYNNTFVGAEHNAADSYSTVINRNNIYYNCGKLGYDPDNPNMQSDHNLVFSTLTRYQPEKYPLDLVNKDPLFTDVSVHDYTLREGSPAIDAGLTIPGFDDDLNGVRRPIGSRWDIGAYEGVGPPSTPPNLRW